MRINIDHLKRFVAASKIKSPVTMNSVWSDSYIFKCDPTGLIVAATDTFTWLIGTFPGEVSETWRAVVARADLDKLVRQLVGAEFSSVECSCQASELVWLIGSTQVGLDLVDTPGIPPFPAKRQERFVFPDSQALLGAMKFTSGFVDADATATEWVVTTYFAGGILMGGSSSCVAVVEGLPPIPRDVSFRSENIQSLRLLAHEKTLTARMEEQRVVLESDLLRLQFPEERKLFALTPAFIKQTTESWVFNRKMFAYHLQLGMTRGSTVFQVEVGKDWVFSVPKKRTQIHVESVSTTASANYLIYVSGESLLQTLKRCRTEEIECQFGKSQLRVRERTEGLCLSAILPLNVDP